MKEELERSIITKFRKTIWRPFSKAVRDYNLIDEGDKIAVCISGGKDSFLLAKLMQEIKRHGTKKFDLVFIVMNPGYEDKNINLIKENAKNMDIPIEVYDSDIFEVSTKLNSEHPCYMCARMRRGFLYNKAQELGCNKIALGHHFDDVIETILMSMLYGAQIKTMMPKVRSTSHEGMQLIRPMYLMKEADIINWREKNELKFINCACRFTEKCTVEPSDDGEPGSKREEMKRLIKKLRKVYPNVDKNIFRSVENVNLDTLISYEKDGVVHNFLDEY